MKTGSLFNTPDRYGLVAQTFHWLIVILIIVQYQMGRLAEHLPLGFEKLVLMSRHKSLGITILGLAILRLAWRFFSNPPPKPADIHPLLRALGSFTHWALYGLLFALPISGWFASSYANAPVSWWGWLTLPDMVAPDKANFELIAELHETLTRILLIVAGTHAVAAVVHHFIFKDSVLRRMLPGWPGMPK